MLKIVRSAIFTRRRRSFFRISRRRRTTYTRVSGLFFFLFSFSFDGFYDSRINTVVKSRLYLRSIRLAFLSHSYPFFFSHTLVLSHAIFSLSLVLSLTPILATSTEFNITLLINDYQFISIQYQCITIRQYSTVIVIHYILQ